MRRLLAVCAMATVFAAEPAAAITPSVTEFIGGVTPGFSANGAPTDIVVGPDGNLWFTEFLDPGGIGRVTPAGVFTEFRGGDTSGFNADTDPYNIAVGPDGNLWFTQNADPGRVSKITPAGDVTEVAEGGVTPGFSANSGPHDIALGPDGNLWITQEADPGRIARITPAGAVTEFTGGVTPNFSVNSGPYGIVSGPDGNLWFTGQSDPGRVTRVTPGGAFTEFTGGVTPGFSANGNLAGINVGPDGALWFLHNGEGRIGRITPAGAVTELIGGVTPGFTADSNPQEIAIGPDGHLWFTADASPGRVGRFIPGGTFVEEFAGGATPGFNPDGDPLGIALGPDGNLWFTEESPPGRIGRITTPPVASTGSSSVLGAGAATVEGTLNGHAQATSYRFEFGPTTGYGSSSPTTDAGSGFATVPATAILSGLEPATTYHYRLVATNPTDATPGADATFTTLPVPSIDALAIRPKTWAAGPALPRISQRRRRPRVGTTISFSLSREAVAQFRFRAVKAGRRVRGRCRPPSRLNRLGRRCRLLRPAGRLEFAGKQGQNRVRFQGRISRRKRLRPGRYQLELRARDLTSPRASSRKASFRIVKR